MRKFLETKKKKILKEKAFEHFKTSLETLHEVSNHVQNVQKVPISYEAELKCTNFDCS